MISLPEVFLGQGFLWFHKRMKIAKIKRMVGLALVLTICLSGCGMTQAKDVPGAHKINRVNNVKAEQIKTVKSQSFDKETKDAAIKILSKGTNRFFCGHRLTGAFFSWFEEVYGKDTLKIIASNGIFDDPYIWKNMTGRTINTLVLDYLRDKGIQKDLTRSVTEVEAEKSSYATFLFCGDLNLAENISTTAYIDRQPNHLANGFRQELIHKMRAADYFVVNNEFSYGREGAAAPLKGKAFTFRADPKRAKLLKGIGTDLVSLANNHVYDYGKKGFLSTLSALKKAKMPYIGAGKNLKEAKGARYVIVNGQTVAILAATQIERSYHYTKAATKNSPGVLKCLDPTEYVKAIRTARRNADVVLCICHWGTEGCKDYGIDQENLARSFVKAGADAVIGGHTHCLQTVEYVNRVPVYYSLGNYYFSSTTNRQKAFDSGLAEIRITGKGKVVPYFYPCRFSDNVTRLLKDNSPQAKKIRQDLTNRSKTAVLMKNGKVSTK